MNKRFIGFFVFFGLVPALLLTACSSKAPIKIGFSACLSGLKSDLGVTGMYGATLRMEEENAISGVNGHLLTMVVEDDKADPDEAVLADQKLKDAGTVAVIGHMESSTIVKSIDWALQNKRLYISPTVSSEAYSGKDDYLFRVISANSLQSYALADMVQDAGHKKVAVLWDNTNKVYSDTLKSFFMKKAVDSGFSMVYDESFNLQENVDYAAIVENLQKSGAEALLIIASSTETALLLENIPVKELGMLCYLAGWSVGADLISRAGTNIEGAFLVNYANLLSETEKYKEFSKRFQEKYGSIPNSGAILSYDAMGVLIDVLKQAPDMKAETLKQTLLQIKTFPGLQSDVVFDKYGDVNRPIYRFTVKDGQYVLLP